VGRPGLEPGTTGLKVHCECNGGIAFQHPPSPILTTRSWPASSSNTEETRMPVLTGVADPSPESYCSTGSLVAVSQAGLCALLGSPGVMSAPSGGFGGIAGHASRSALVCLTTM